MEFEENSGVMEQEVAAPEGEYTESTPQEEETATQQEGEGQADVADQQQEIPNEVWRVSRERAEREARQRVDRQIAARFGQYQNPVTGEPVRTLDDYFAALDAQEEAQNRRIMENATSQLPQETREALLSVFENNPKQRALEAQINALQSQLNAQEGERMLAEQMQELRQLDPEVTSLEYLVAQPEFPEFDRMVRTGLSLTDAYKLAFFDRLTQRNTAATKQAAINAARSKSHLAPAGNGQGAPDDGLTDEMIAEYRQFNPRMTRAEIARYHKKYEKENS